MIDVAKGQPATKFKRNQAPRRMLVVSRLKPHKKTACAGREADQMRLWGSIAILPKRGRVNGPNSPKAEKGKNHQNDNHGTDDIDNPVHM